VDDTLCAESNTTISYLLDEPMLGRHTITIEAYDNAGNIAVDEREMWIFNI
jgi:hypothetical protein